MGTIIQSDIIEGASATVNESGLTVQRVFIVQESAAGSPARRIINALSTTGVPRRYDVYPGETGLFCTSVDCKPEDNENFRITATYGVLPVDEQAPSAVQTPKLSVSSSVQTAETTTDVNGDLMAVSYAGDPEPQVATVEIQKPQTIMKYSRKEPTPPLGFQEYVGKVNSAGWKGFPARVWLLSRIDATPTEDDTGYNVEYEFVYEPESWDKIVFYTDPTTGKVPIDVEVGVGAIIYQVYHEADFNALNIT